MAEIFKLNSIDTLTRKNWLKATLANYIIFPLAMFLIAAIFGCATTGLFSELIKGIIAFWILYNCTYKKYGYRWLTWSLVMGPIVSLIGIHQLLAEDTSNITVFFVTLAAAFYVWWYIASLRLRKINIKLEPQVIAVSNRLKDIYTLRESDNLTTLESRYRSLLKKQPEFKKILTEEYEHLKSILLKRKCFKKRTKAKS